jgi:alpha-L-rhamnosidase
MGWTGDAQVFSKTACYNFDCDKFYRKWLSDLELDQRADGSVPIVIPMPDEENLSTSAAWADAAVIIPWDMYLTYGDKDILQRQYHSMERHLEFIAASSPEPYQWVGGSRFGDWLGLDAPSGSYKGSTREDFVASAYYAYDVALMIHISEILGKDAEKYRTLHENIVRTFREIYPTYETQTECVLALHFGLTPDPEATAAQLAKMVEDAGKSLKTGFVGTPYLLYTLSRNGYQELAYDLLLRQEYPGWLYSVGKGATTIWEHWDGIKEDGGFWSTDMNSFNHYAYGSVMGWVYEEAAGIHTVEDAPGFGKVRIAPKPDQRLGWLEASIDTPAGKIFSGWYYELEGLRYEIHTPVPALLELDGKTLELEPGSHLFFAE